MAEVLRWIAGILVVLAALLALHLVTALFPQWPLWLCVLLGGIFLGAMAVAQARPADHSGDDDSEA